MNADYLGLLAEIAAALAGFGALLGLIGQYDSPESAAVDAGRLRGMLERALCVVALALLPIALGQFELDEDLVWTLCACALIALGPTLNVSQIARLRRLANYAPGLLYFASAQLTVAIEIGLLLMALLGHLSLPAAYGFALLLELSTAGGQFLRVVKAITSSRA